MTDLSPAAQAVLNAAIGVAESPHAEAIAAAALRAAAIYSYCPMDRQRLAAIADELENQ